VVLYRMQNVPVFKLKDKMWDAEPGYKVKMQHLHTQHVTHHVYA